MSKRRYKEKAEKRGRAHRVKFKKRRLMKRFGVQDRSKPSSEQGSGVSPPTPPRPRLVEEVKVLVEDSGSDTELNSPKMASELKERKRKRYDLVL